MQPTFPRHAAALALGTLLVLYACTGNAPIQFYTLTPLPAPSQPAPAESAGGTGPVIGIGPVTLPDYLNRPQMVTRTGENGIAISDEHHWAGELKSAFTRVLVEDLSLLLPSDRIATYPWHKDLHVQYQATVSVMKFDGRLGKHVTLQARWFLFDAHGKLMLAKRVRFVESMENSSYAALAAAQSKALAHLSREIAAEVQKAAKSK